MAKTPEEMQKVINLLGNARFGLASLAGKGHEAVYPVAMQIGEAIKMLTEPSTPAPIAAQTEPWSANQLLDTNAVDKLNAAIGAAEQVDAARLEFTDQQLIEIKKSLGPSSIIWHLVDEVIRLRAASLKQEPQPPDNFSFHLAHILDICYFNPGIESHGCMPDETGRCMVAACACKCHFAPVASSSP